MLSACVSSRARVDQGRQSEGFSTKILVRRILLVRAGETKIYFRLPADRRRKRIIRHPSIYWYLSTEDLNKSFVHGDISPLFLIITPAQTGKAHLFI